MLARVRRESSLPALFLRRLQFLAHSLFVIQEPENRKEFPGLNPNTRTTIPPAWGGTIAALHLPLSKAASIENQSRGPFVRRRAALLESPFPTLTLTEEA